MPRRNDLRKILVLGPGPLPEHGGEAEQIALGCLTLREEGYEVLLLSSSPWAARKELAHRTYMEPMIPEVLMALVQRERPEAILTTLGGAMGIQLVRSLGATGLLEALGCELIGADGTLLARAEDRVGSQEALGALGIHVPRLGHAHDLGEALAILEKVGLPAMIGPRFAPVGVGCGMARTREAFEQIVLRGLALSPVTEVTVEGAMLGWKRIALEILRDRRDNATVLGGLESLDPVGVHPADAWEVIPPLTVSDHALQRLREAALGIVRTLGVCQGAATIEFALHPRTGRFVLLEAQPRLTRTSALVSKAMGLPLAQWATRLAIGYHLDELTNSLTGNTACFEPSLDYVLVRAPRFEEATSGPVRRELGPNRQSTGDALGLGRTFKEALMKAIQSLGWEAQGLLAGAADDLEARLSLPTSDRLFAVGHALALGTKVKRLAEATGFDAFFLQQLDEIVEVEKRLKRLSMLDENGQAVMVREAKRLGFSDARLAAAWGIEAPAVRDFRGRHAIVPVYKHIDSCAGELLAASPFAYSCYEDEDEVTAGDRPAVLLLGSGPDVGGSQAAQAIREAGFRVLAFHEEGVASAGSALPDRLYLDPMTLEHVLQVVEREHPLGVILNQEAFPGSLAMGWEHAEVPILGGSRDGLALQLPPGRASGAKTVEVVALAEGRNAWIAGVIEDLDAGDLDAEAVSCWPPLSLKPAMLAQLEAATRELARSLELQGIMCARFEVQQGPPQIQEIRLDASERIAFLSSATGIPWARFATRLMLGEHLASLAIPQPRQGWAVRILVSPRELTKGTHPGPRGEVMGFGASFAEAFAKAMLGSPAGWFAPGPLLVLGDLPISEQQAWQALDFSPEPWQGFSSMLALSAQRYSLVLEAPLGVTPAPWDEARRVARDAKIPWTTSPERMGAWRSAIGWLRQQPRWRVRSLQEAEV